MRQLQSQTENCRKGWVAGFYGAHDRDSLAVLDEILRHGVEDDQKRAEFLSGYRAGRIDRGGVIREFAREEAFHPQAA